MKTHPDSIFAKLSDVCDLSVDGSGHIWCTNEDVGNRSNVTEFVPASAYIELKSELAAANAQLQTQTENMLALREFVGKVASVTDWSHRLQDGMVDDAQELFARITP
jgi:hypothetical protein